jgi:nitroreductase
MEVDAALRTRMSVRAFKRDLLPEKLVREILDVARFAPSGGNVQPWKIIAVAGQARDTVSEKVKARLADGTNEVGDRPIYPANLWPPYRDRRHKVGEDMYALLGIAREDKRSRYGHLARNYDFFGAPVGLFFVIDRRMGHGQWAHLGMLMQSIALAAVSRGVSSCMQEAWAHARDTLHVHFQLPAEEMIYCGMALGYADAGARVNSLRSDRAPVEEIATFQSFNE